MYLYYLYSYTDLRYRNALYFMGMPTDLAIAIDTMVDGEANAYGQYYDTNGTAWTDASTTTTVSAAYTINIP